MDKTVIKAEVVADSINQQGDRLTSLLITFPRIILAEVNTHRMLSKNTSSSRAIPFKKMVEAVQNDPFIPIAWQKNHSGMQGTEYLTGLDIDQCEFEWLTARDSAVEQAQQLNMINTTKQLCNRLLEPFMWTTMLITGSKEGWDNFFRLRCPQYHYDLEDIYFKSKKEWLTYYRVNCIGNSNSNFELYEMDWFNINKGQSEIHMMALAEAIYDAMNESTPNQLKAGEWHIPYEDRISSDVEKWSDDIDIQTALWGEDLTLLKVKVSTAMAARESYTVVGNEKNIDYQKQIDLHDRLIEQDPPHCFTEGTEILTDKGWKYFENINEKSKIASVNVEDLRFNGFENPDNIIEEDYNGVVYELPQGGISISPNHILLGNMIYKSSDRSKTYTDVSKIIPKNKEPNTRRINIFREIRMFSACNPQYGENKDSMLYLTGVLYGFFIGDGHCKHRNVYFHLKKKRKIKFLENLLLALNREYSITEYNDGSVNFIISEDTNVFTDFYDSNKNKIIPDFLPCDSVLFLNGLFDGLKNSDGSVKRNTWIYDTCSEPLHDRILELCPLIGLTGISYDTYDHFRIGFTTDNNVLINDSRRNDSKVIEKKYSGKLYCVEIPSKGIIVRKNGKVLITHNSSPLEHCNRAMTEDEYYSFVKGQSITTTKHIRNRFTNRHYGWCNNIKGFIPYRYMIDNNLKL